MKKNYEDPVVEIVAIEDVVANLIPGVSGGGGVI